MLHTNHCAGYQAPEQKKKNLCPQGQKSQPAVTKGCAAQMSRQITVGAVRVRTRRVGTRPRTTGQRLRFQQGSTVCRRYTGLDDHHVTLGGHRQFRRNKTRLAMQGELGKV